MITWGDNLECSSRRISVRVKEEFEVGGYGHRFKAERDHGCLVEDRESATEGGEVNHGGVGDLVARRSWAGSEI